MAIYTINISGKGNSSLARTYTIEAGREDIARRIAQQRLAVDPQFRNLPFNGYSVAVKFEDFVAERERVEKGGYGQGGPKTALDEIDRREKESVKKAKDGDIVAGKQLENFAKNEGEEAAALQNQNFSDFKDNFVTPGQFNPSANPNLPPQGYDTEELISTPDFTSGFIPSYERDALADKDPKQVLIDEQLAAAQLAAGGNPSTDIFQTEASRRGQLESSNSFAAFLDELDKAGLGGLQGSAGRFMKDQYYPLKTAYEAQQILPLAQGAVPFGQDLTNLAPEDAKAYQDALTRQQANKYTEDYGKLNPGASGGYQVGDMPSQGALPTTVTNPFTRAEDEATIAAYSPSFGAYAQGALQAGGRQAQQRIGQQLQSLAQMDMTKMAPGSFSSQMLAPEDGKQAGFLQSLAREAMGGRYSGVARNALSRFINEDDIYARYVQQSTPMVGASMAGTTPQNFAQYVGQSYGLF